MKTSDYQKPLSEICMIRTGKKDANHGDKGGDYLFFTCADKPILSPTYSFDGDSIILPGNGANVGLVLFYSGKFEAYQRTYVLSDFQCDPRYLFHHLRAFWRQHNEFKQFGSATNYIKMQNFHDYQVFLPPLEEQRRIAAILDKADAVRRKRQSAIALTEELLRSAFLEMFGDPVTNPKGWEVKPMYEVIQRIEAGWSANGEDRRCEDNEWGVLKISAVTSGRFQADEYKVVENLSFKKRLIVPQRGDLLFSRANTRELVAATCLVEKDYKYLFLPDKLWRIKPDPKVANTEYIRFLLSDPKYRSLIARKATGTSGSMLNVSQAKLLGMDAPIPQLGIQQRFAEIVWQMIEIREHYELACSTAKTAFDSLLQRAFQGNL